jgi:hypothetical protein
LRTRRREGGAGVADRRRCRSVERGRGRLRVACGRGLGRVALAWRIAGAAGVASVAAAGCGSLAGAAVAGWRWRGGSPALPECRAFAGPAACRLRAGRAGVAQRGVFHHRAEAEYRRRFRKYVRDGGTVFGGSSGKTRPTLGRARRSRRDGFPTRGKARTRLAFSAMRIQNSVAVKLRCPKLGGSFPGGAQIAGVGNTRQKW